MLLQPGKTDAGALFTSNISNSAFGPRGTASVLSKITVGAAVGFMLLALLISMPALQGNVSVLQTTSAETPAEAPADTNTNTAANANTAPATDANAAPAANTEAPAVNAPASDVPANK